MTAAVTNLPISTVFMPSFAPGTSEAAMSDAERRTMILLSARLADPTYQAELTLSRLYYDCLNVVPSLGISVPPELEALRGILGWCKAGVDARSERLTVMGFRMPNQTEIDSDLQIVWQTNNLDSESLLVHDDEMIVGRCFVIVGKNPDSDIPLITTEAAENMIGTCDVRTRSLSSAYQSYLDTDPMSQTYLKQLATFYTRDSTVQLMLTEQGWIVQDRNDHHQGFVPVQMFAHAATIKNRYGSSVMNAAWRNTQDRACRTLVRSEVSGEFFATLKIFILGAAEKSFKNPDGSPASPWETFIGRISALDADEHGNLPQIKEIKGDSPDGFITTIDSCAQIMSGHTGLPPHYHGIFSDGNPASADAIRMSDFRLKTAADRLGTPIGNDWESVMRMTMRMTGSDITAEAQRLETDWAYTGIPTPYADTEMLARQTESQMVPPTADDVLAKAGWTPVQRQRLRAERDRTAGLATLTDALAGLNTAPAAGQAADGQQPQALTALDATRSTDGALAG